MSNGIIKKDGKNVGKNDVFIQKVISSAAEYSSKWKYERYSSQKVVKDVKKSVANGKYCVESCAVLLALEMRIKERYATIFSTLLRYFSWKRESSLLGALKQSLKIPDNSTVEQYVMTSDDPRGEESDEGERSGEGKNAEEKKKSEGKEELSEKNDLIPEKVEENLEEELSESDEEEKEKETSPREKEEETKKESDKKTVEENVSPKDENKEISDDKEKKKSENGKERSSERTINNLTEKENSVKSSDVEAYEKANKNVYAEKSVYPVEAPLEVFRAGTEQKKDESSERIIYEHYDRPSENISSALRNDRNEPVKDKDARNNYMDRDSKRPVEKPVDNSKGQDDRQSKREERQPQKPLNKEPLSEENKARIAARDTFAKMSEDELVAIQHAMQESLNREMDMAEANGEIFKIPLTVKEAFDKSDSLVSERKQEAPSTDKVIKK